MSESQFKSYVPPDTDMPELTLRAVLVGVILAIILGAANAYLGLVAGMTVAATFPAAVIAMAALRPFKGTILEENIARTTGAVGEALAAGAIFTIPAFLISGVWTEFDYVKSTILMLIGGVLGVFFIIIVRRTLVEDVTLPFPESQACSEIVKAGQKGGSGGAKYVFWAMGLGGLIELLKNSNGILIIKPYIKYVFSLGDSVVRFLGIKKEAIAQGFTGRMMIETPAASAALTGVGYIIGPKYAAITFSGGVFGWLFLMPIALFLGTNLSDYTQFASWKSIASSVYNAQVKPIAVGAMLVGAFWTLYKMRKNLLAGVKRSMGDMKKSGSASATAVVRTDKDISFGKVLLVIGILIIPMIFVYNTFTQNFGGSIVAALVMALAGLLFAAVAGYLVGIIGSSSNPISGLTLTTLLIAAVLMVALGVKGDAGVAAVLGVAAVVCCVAGVAGDMIQDWKVGHILGGTPWRMEIAGTIGVIFAALTLVVPIALLHNANIETGGIGGEVLPAPQAGLMAMMAKGIVAGEMAWPLVIAGMVFSVALILIGSPSPMLIAVGMYLPFHSTACIFIGGVIKLIVDKVAAKKNPDEQQKTILANTGLLIASGLVAGEALTGVITAGLKTAQVELPKILGLKEGTPWLGLVVFAVLAYVLIYYPYKAMLKGEK
ncbi:oligopeptide transporter, OPT family [candidate division KSB1 bacterium]|nr:MAG: oligopeptide transporter, OPT family [candidate division KSB1 bacterium]